MPLYLLLASSRPAPELAAPGLPTGDTTSPAPRAEETAIGGGGLRTGPARVLFKGRDAKLEPPAGLLR